MRTYGDSAFFFFFFDIRPITGQTATNSEHLNYAADGVAVNWWAREDTLSAETVEAWAVTADP